MSVRRLALSGAAAGAAVLLVAAPAFALPAFGTAPVSGGGPATGPQTVVAGIATGHHAGYDRVVFTFTGPMPHYAVSYVPRVVHDASGAPVPLLGSAFLAVGIRPTSTSHPAPQGTRTPLLPMLRQIKGAGDFEAVTSYGIGAASRSGFRAFTLTAPNRLVIDLAIPGTSAGSSTGTGGTSAGTTGGGSASGSDGAGGLARTGRSSTLPLAVGGLGLVGLGAAGLWFARLRGRPALAA